MGTRGLKEVFTVVASGAGVVFGAGVSRTAGVGVAANSRVGAWPLLLSSQLSLDVLDVKPDLPESPDSFWSVLLINVDGVFGEVTVMCVVGTVTGFSVLVCVLQMKVPASFPGLYVPERRIVEHSLHLLNREVKVNKTEKHNILRLKVFTLDRSDHEKTF